VNYLRACPLPEAAVALAEVERIDPEAVRRAATLAGLAGLTTAAPTGDDPGPAGSPGPATEPASAAVATTTGASVQVAPVIADEEGSTDPAVAPASAPTPPAIPTPPNTGPATWKWALWAVLVLVVAVVARRMLRPSAGTRAAT
jgi:hypothetical protein